MNRSQMTLLSSSLLAWALRQAWACSRITFLRSAISAGGVIDGSLRGWGTQSLHRLPAGRLLSCFRVIEFLRARLWIRIEEQPPAEPAEIRPSHQEHHRRPAEPVHPLRDDLREYRGSEVTEHVHGPEHRSEVAAAQVHRGAVAARVAAGYDRRGQEEDDHGQEGLVVWNEVRPHEQYDAESR